MPTGTITFTKKATVEHRRSGRDHPGLDLPAGGRAHHRRQRRRDRGPPAGQRCRRRPHDGCAADRHPLTAAARHGRAPAHPLGVGRRSLCCTGLVRGAKTWASAKGPDTRAALTYDARAMPTPSQPAGRRYPDHLLTPDPVRRVRPGPGDASADREHAVPTRSAPGGSIVNAHLAGLTLAPPSVRPCQLTPCRPAFAASHGQAKAAGRRKRGPPPGPAQRPGQACARSGVVDERREVRWATLVTLVKSPPRNVWPASAATAHIAQARC